MVGEHEVKNSYYYDTLFKETAFYLTTTNYAKTVLGFTPSEA